MNQVEREFNLPEDIKEILLKESIDLNKIIVHDLVESHKQNHYWHGGNIVSIKYEDSIFEISAAGDVIVNLYEKESNDLVMYVKDKNNRGVLYQELSSYIENDDELYLLLEDKHPKYLIEISNNNWWECGIIRNKVYHDLMWDLEGTTLTDAIVEVYINMEDVYKDTFLDEAV